MTMSTTEEVEAAEHQFNGYVISHSFNYSCMSLFAFVSIFGFGASLNPLIAVVAIMRQIVTFCVFQKMKSPALKLN